jgi:hypothetical protein
MLRRRENDLSSVRQLSVHLPEGRWKIVQADLIGRTERVLADEAVGEFRFRTPGSRAVLTHFRRK